MKSYLKTPEEVARDIFSSGPVCEKRIADLIREDRTGRNVKVWPKSCRALFSGTRETNDRLERISACTDLDILDRMSKEKHLGKHYRMRCEQRARAVRKHIEMWGN